MLIKNIIRGQDLSTGTQKFAMTRNLVIGEAIRVYDQNNRDRGMETNVNYGLLIKDFITHFFPLKEPQSQNIYLLRVLYNTNDTKTIDFIFRIDEMVDNLENFPPFGIG